jgi:Zn-dependent peptidase ImmA (M78 family)
VRLAAFRNHVSSEAIDPKEIEANRFAAALLMPVPFLEKSLKARRLPLRESGIQELAREYGVSAQAMNYRLANLGIAIDMAG